MIVLGRVAVGGSVAVVSPVVVIAVTGTGVWVAHNAQDARPEPFGPSYGRLAIRPVQLQYSNLSTRVLLDA